MEKMMEVWGKNDLKEIQKKSKYSRLINWRKTYLTYYNVCHVTLKDISYQECIVISLDKVNHADFDRKLSDAFNRVIRKAEELKGIMMLNGIR